MARGQDARVLGPITGAIIRAWTLLAVFALSWLSGPATAHASPATELRSDPPRVEFRPGDGQRALALVNAGSDVIAIDRVLVDGRDWGSFSIASEATPRRVDAGQKVIIDLVADERSFAQRDEQGALRAYGRGDAQLRVLLESGEELEVDLAFRPRPHGIGAGAWLRLILAIGLGALALRLAKRLDLGPDARPHSRVMYAVGLCLTLGTLVWTEALDPRALLEPAGPLSLAQLRNLGHVSAPFVAPGSALFFLVGWTCLRLGSEPLGEWSSIVQRAAQLGLLTLALALQVGSLEIHDIADAQARAVPGWSAVFGPWFLTRNPFAAAGLLLLLAHHNARRGDARTRPQDWILCLWTSTLLLGAWRVGVEDGWAPQIVTWPIGIVVLLAKSSLLLRLRFRTSAASERAMPLIWMCALGGVGVAALS